MGKYDKKRSNQYDTKNSTRKYTKSGTPETYDDLKKLNLNNQEKEKKKAEINDFLSTSRLKKDIDWTEIERAERERRLEEERKFIESLRNQRNQLPSDEEVMRKIMEAMKKRYR